MTFLLCGTGGGAAAVAVAVGDTQHKKPLDDDECKLWRYELESLARLNGGWIDER